MKPNYFIIPLIVIGVSTLGSWFTSQGVNTWYQTLNLPGWTPPGSFIGLVWTILYVLVAVSALFFWNRARRGRIFKLITGIFLFNAFLNVFWSYLFFTQNSLFLAFLEILVLEASIIALIVLLWRVSKFSSALLWPYALWVAFAGYLNYIIWQLNSLT